MLFHQECTTEAKRGRNEPHRYVATVAILELLFTIAGVLGRDVDAEAGFVCGRHVSPITAVVNLLLSEIIGCPAMP